MKNLHRCAAWLAMTLALIGFEPAYSQVSEPHVHEQKTSPSQPDDGHGGMPMTGADGSMEMGGMQGGRAPEDARNSENYSDGFENSTLPNYEMADKISVPKFLVEELEFVTGNEGEGANWSLLVTKGQDDDKFWFRSQGLKVSGERLDPESSAELLWWHSKDPFWGTLLGVRQDIGRGATTWLAAGVEGLVPYWFDIQLTGYLGDDGRLAARLKASYEVVLTNQLILTPQVESNLYSKRSRERELGGGLSNVELSARLRYEFTRKFAPYVGFVWERAYNGTADYRRLQGGPVTERRIAAGVRLWW